MMEITGRLSFLQYMSMKPIKRGIQFFSLCDSVNSYCLQFIIYTGREDIFVSGEGFTFNIMNELLSDNQYKYHIVYTDNYYNSLKLAKYLLATGTYLVVTIRRTSRGFPHIDAVCISYCDHFKVTSTDVIVDILTNGMFINIINIIMHLTCI